MVGCRRNRRAVACAIKQFQTASLAKKPEGTVDGGDESPTDGQAEKVQNGDDESQIDKDVPRTFKDELFFGATQPQDKS